jgi:16S rRNA (cytosine967-C5)-methyltransferase
MFLVERWHRRFKPQLCRQICLAGATRPKLVMRANVRRITPAALLERLRISGHPAEFVTGTEAIVLRDALPLTQLPEFGEGLCQPQDSTAQLAVQMAAPKPGEIVLDLCAGVGTKSTQAAELMNDAGIVIASDVDGTKLAKIRENAGRLGLPSIRTCDSTELEPLLSSQPRRPDLIIADVPCSNTAVLARRPEARYRASQKQITSLVQLQREILLRATLLAGPATRLLYSTCSIEREENESQAAWFIERFPGWKIVHERFTLPDLDRDGGYAVVLSRNE